MAEPKQELTYGQRAAGVSFNPSNDPLVYDLKIGYADLIDSLNKLRENTDDGEQKRLISIAITEAQGAQMWAVKAATWGAK